MKLQYIEGGEIVSTHGVRGEFKVLPWVDSPEFLTQFNRVVIDNKTYPVQSCRVQKTCNLMKIADVDTVEQAQSLRGKTILLYREDAPDDLIFAAELFGVKVFSEGEEIGEIADVLDSPGNKVYIVRGEHEYMIPAVSAFVSNIDLDNGVMEVRLIEGMRTDES